MRAVAIIMQFVGMKTVAMQITMAAAYTTAGGILAPTPRAAVPSRGSGERARRHCGKLGAQWRFRAPQPLLEALEIAPATVESWVHLLKDLHVPENTYRNAEEMKMLICMRSM